MLQAISAGHQQTLNSAKLILEEGGNAFDAAIAAYFTMFLTEPCMASAGAGGFALCHKPGTPAKMLDFFTQTPSEKNLSSDLDFNPITVDFGNEQETFHTGLASVAVPGAIAGIFALHKEYASIPMEVLIQPSLDLNRQGAIMDSFQSMDLVLLEPIFRKDTSVSSVFFPKGELLRKGDKLNMPHFSDFANFIVREGPRGFYEGEISVLIDRESQRSGGFIRRNDLLKYKAFWRKPLTINYHGYKLILPNGPSLGGAIMALLMHNLNSFDGDWVKSILEFQRQKFGPRQLEMECNRLYPKLDCRITSSSSSSRGTSHFNIHDKWGNTIALTSSIGEGSGYFIPGTDMHLNNMLGEASLLPNGFHSWEADVRLNSMMTPTMVLNMSDQLIYSGGSGGAARIPYMIAQVLEYIFKQQMPLELATLSPRVYLHHGKLHFESGMSIDYEGDLPLQEWNYQSLFFGGVHSILNKNGKIEAAGDQRRYGVAEIF